MLENSWDSLKIQINNFINDLDQINNLLSKLNKPANYDFLKIYYELLEKAPPEANKETIEKLKIFFLKYSDIDFTNSSFVRSGSVLILSEAFSLIMCSIFNN